MILDRLENAIRYVPVHPGFEAAFNFLKQNSLNEFKEGKDQIDGDRLFALALTT